MLRGSILFLAMGLWLAALAVGEEGGPPVATPTSWQIETFGPLAALPGRTYRGRPTEESSAAQTDIQAWEWALGGAGLSITHALEDGSYGGETLVYHDKALGGLAYVYVTNAGFRSEGIFTLNTDGSWSALEDVAGHDQVTKVRSTGTLRADGSMVMASEYLKNGAWVAGHGFIYEEVDGLTPALTSPGAP